MTYETTFTPVRELRPGMRLAIQKRDGSIEPGATIVRVEIDDYDGSAEIVLDSGSRIREDAERMANDSSIATATPKAAI